MPLNSASYIGFLLSAAFFYWLIPRKWRLSALIFFGIAYYAYAGFSYLVLLLALSIATYVGSARREYFVYTLSVIAITLAFFKYVGGVLPLGISFYTFELIHYLAESFRGTTDTRNIKTFLAFIFFFPTRASGPIKRYGDFADQARSVRFAPKYLYYGAGLLVLGFFQKIVIADPLIPITSALQTPDTLDGSFDVFFRLNLYSIRIYADFMGLTNIAMGSGLLFGILVPRNFNYPYLKPNIALFWRNWHMSLSNWVRDYIYIPLGGSRQGECRTFLNLLVAMFIIGIWHGSSMNFVVWGIYHGAGLIGHRIWKKYYPSRWEGVMGRGSVLLYWSRYTVGVLFTFFFVTMGWAFFVTGSLPDSLLLFKILFHV